LAPETAVTMVKDRGSNESADKKLTARPTCDTLENGWFSTTNALRVRSDNYDDDLDVFNWHESMASGRCSASQRQTPDSLPATSPKRVTEIWLALLGVLRGNWLCEPP